MFFIIPIGHDDLSLRGLPFATIGLMLSMLVVFLLTGAMDDSAPVESSAKRGDEISYADALIDAEADGAHTARPTARAAPVPNGETDAAPRSRAGRIAHRFGFVPSHPGLGILTHPFLHGGVVSLLISLVFLWAVAVKLESLWSRPVFLACFAVFAVASALVHAAVTSSPDEPLVGSAGAIAGLMGASLVRLGRSKVYYAYFVWLFLKPKVGTFDAPAYLTPVLWLVTMLGAQLASMTFNASIGPVFYTAWLGGFAVGCATAFAFKRLRFEERVLHREPEVVVDPEEMPLVAFQRVEERPRARTERMERLAATTLVSIDRTVLRFTDARGAPLELNPGDVVVWTAGKLARIDPTDATSFEGAPQRAPAVLLGMAAVGPGPSGADRQVRIVVVDAARLKYSALLDAAPATPRDAFFSLVSKLHGLLPSAAFAGDLARLRAGELPEHASLRDFFSRLEDAVILAMRGR